MKHRVTISLGMLWLGMMALPALGATPKRVLIVHSFGMAAPPFTTHSTAFEAELTERMGERVDVDEVSLDMARYADLDMQEALVEFLNKRQTKWQPDLVVPIGSPAGVFVAQYRDRLFPATTPIIYTGMDQRRLPPDALERNAAFVGESFNFPDLVEDMLQVAPATTNIVVVLGASPVERYWAAAIQQEWAPFTNRVSFTWLNDLPFDQMSERVANLPPRSFIFLILLMRDAAGVSHNADEALKRIHAVANAPVNSIYQHQLGAGIVGGRLYQAELEGAESARIAVRILHGEPATNFPPKIVGRLSPRYDWRELRRWKMSEAQLPPGSKVLFREQSVWQRYWWWILGGVLVVLLETGLILLLVANSLKRRRVEEQLRESESRFRIVADSAPVLIWMSGVDKLCTFVNKAWLDFTGRSVEQEMGNGWTASVHPDDLAGCLKIYGDSFDARQPSVMQYRLRRYDGEYRWVTDHGVPRYDARGNFAGYIGSCSDVTERRQEADRFRQIVETSPSVLVMVNGDGKIVLTNTQVENVFGYRREELVGQAIETLIPEGFRPQHREHRDKFGNALKARPLGAGWELFGRRKDGRKVPVEIGLSPIQTPEGLFTLASVVDITERKQNEEEIRLLRLEAWHADRVARTGAITSSLAHELNQPLAAILSNAQAALRFMAGEKTDLGEIRDILSDIVADDKRAGAVISGLRSMLRRQETNREPVLLGDAIQETLDLLHSEMLAQHVEARLRRETDCTVLADKPQIQQVILNLAMNAVEAMRDQPGSRRRIEVTVARSADDQALVTIRDTGPGISDEHIQKLFDAFWTSKPTGMGIGLSICRSILEAHGGRIWLANNQPDRTTFRFTLPIAPTVDSTQTPPHSVE